MNPRYPLVAQRAGHRCEYCHAPEVAFNFAFEIDHIYPGGTGGSEDDRNLAMGCRSCNLYKSDDTMGQDPVTSEATRLFNPRLDRWEDHFCVEPENFIAGVSPIGRTTAVKLRLNSPKQLAARTQWRILKLFP